MAQDDARGNARPGRGEGARGGRRVLAREGRGGGRAAEAKRHTEDVAQRLSGEIARSREAVRFFEGAPKRKTAEPEAGAALAVPEVEVVDQDSVSAVLGRGRGIASACDLAVLDFASFTQPGGGYIRGTMAQEESLCAESFLYNVLDQLGDWYAENRRRNINCELYRDRAFVVPKVRFERERYHSFADVIVAAAPNARRAREDYHVDAPTLERAMRSRIRLALAIADELGHDKLVLGAFGCGVFGWDAATVAELFREELAGGSHVASKVTFAVPKGRFDENLERFEHAFAKFPEKNEDAYVSRAAREAELRAETSARDAEDDEGEDDWRKYL